MNVTCVQVVPVKSTPESLYFHACVNLIASGPFGTAVGDSDVLAVAVDVTEIVGVADAAGDRVGEYVLDVVLEGLSDDVAAIENEAAASKMLSAVPVDS